MTNAEVTLASPSAVDLITLDNRYVVTINTNDGSSAQISWFVAC